MDKLLKTYEEILDFCAMKVRDDDVVVSNFGFGNDKEVKINGRLLVLPTKAQLSKYDPEKVVIFHPFHEHINKGESDVVKRLRQHLNLKINYVTMNVASSLLALAASPDEHAKLTPEQRELLKVVRDADKKSVENFASFVLKHYNATPLSFFTNIYLKKAGTFRGEKHSRVGVVSFPYYEFLAGNEVKYSRKADRPVFESLLKFIYPTDNVEGEDWNGFSDSRDIPWLHCLLSTAHGLLGRLKELQTLYKEWAADDDAPETLNHHYDELWLENLNDLTPYRAALRRLPSQAGNEGNAKEEEEEPAKKVGTPRREEAARPKPNWEPDSRPVQEERRAPQRREDVREDRRDDDSPYYVDDGRSRARHDPRQPYVDVRDPYRRPDRRLVPPPRVYPREPERTSDGKLNFRSVMETVPAVAAAGMVNTVLTEWDRGHRAPLDPRTDPRLDPRSRDYDARMDPHSRYYDPRYDPYYDPRQAYHDPRVQDYDRRRPDPYPYRGRDYRVRQV
jgi:hypothetical protein